MSDTFRKIVNFPVGIKTTVTASAGTDIPNLSQVQSLVAGLSNVKEAVAVDADSNFDIATGGLPIIDAYQVLDGDRVLLHSQTDTTENGIYIAGAGAWTRATDADQASELPTKTSVTVLNGTHAGRKYELQEDEPVVDTDAQTWIVTAASSSAAVDTTADDTNFNAITGTNVQAALDSIDDTLVGVSSTVDTIVGVTATDGDLGTFTGSTIPDDQNIKQALQALETKVEQNDDIYLNNRYESASTSLTTGNAINFAHSLGERWLSQISVYEASTGEDITHTVTVTAVDASNLTVKNDDADISVIVVARV